MKTDTPEALARKREYDRLYYIANRERIKAAVKARRDANPEAERQRARDYAAQHRQESRARASAWAKAHPERVQKKNKAWLDRNPDWKRRAKRDKKLRRRAAKKGALGALPVRRNEIWARDCGVCHICGLACDPCNWHLDHIIPLSRGGIHSPENVAVSHPLCNARKGNRLDFRAT